MVPTVVDIAGATGRRAGDSMGRGRCGRRQLIRRHRRGRHGGGGQWARRPPFGRVWLQPVTY